MTRFKNIYEASGVQQMGDGRVVIIEDEKSRAISHVLTLKTEDILQENPLRFDQKSKSIKTKLIDLEGIADDVNDNLFAITSYSPSIKGKLKQSRQRLVRFRIKENLISNFEVFETLGNCIRKKIGVNRINIEAISFDENGKKLLIGLREPLFEGRSLIIVLENPNAIFDSREEPKFSDKIFRLDLNSSGIRAMDFDKKLGGYLIVNEIKNSEGKLRSRFWFWPGNADDQPRKIAIDGMENIKNIEGITSMCGDGEPRILIVSDDGNIIKRKGAHYTLIRYDQLSIFRDPLPGNLSPHTHTPEEK
ncbi:MAG: hypothetical protein DSY90_10175 [Deltaproteobacteria bacterium]|nr:MAG: hypothetical protein DSY90_10175 [Deltaproteobacteria bacterium]